MNSGAKPKIQSISKIENLSSFMNYRKINCLTLKKGLFKTQGTYYLCDCDPERSNPICEECFKQCHSGKDHHKIKQFTRMDICMCGFKGHQPMNQSETSDDKYSHQCFFGESAFECKYGYFYVNPANPNSKICLLCKNICAKNDNLVKATNISEKETCSCTNTNHNDIRIVLRKLRSIAKKENFKTKYDFEAFEFVQLINMITRTKKYFENIFHSFNDKLQGVYTRIKNEPTYFLEGYKFINNLHLTSSTLSHYALKCKNVYDISVPYNDHKMSDTYYIQYSIKCKPLLYLRDEIKKILTPSIFFAVMNKEFDYKSKNIWMLKESLATIYLAFCVGRDFVKYPNIKVHDIMLLNPLQRLMLISNIKKENEMNDYINNLNFNILDCALQVLLKITKSGENLNEIFVIYNRLFKICQFYAKFSLFNHEQVRKFSSINDKIIFEFISTLKDDRNKVDQQKLKFKVLSPMMKSLVFLAYTFNDQILLSYLKNEHQFKNVNFFHTKSETCKLLAQNATNCLSYIQELTPDYQIENFQNEDEEQEQPDEEQNDGDGAPEPNHRKKRKKKKDTLIDFCDDAKLKKCLKNVIKNANEIIYLILGCPDNYAIGLGRIVSKTFEINYEFYNDNMSNEENDFVLKMRGFFEQLENEYFYAFDNYKDTIPTLEKNMNEILNKVIDECKIGNVEFRHQNISSVCFDEERLLVGNGNKEANKEGNTSMAGKYRSFPKQKRDSSDMSQDSVGASFDQESKMKMLLNKTYLIQSIYKGIQIMYSFHLTSNNKNKFYVEHQIFQKILSISYFFVKNNSENSFLFLTTDILSSIELLNDEQLYTMLDLVENSLRNIYLTSGEITVNTKIIHLLKIASSKTAKCPDITDKILKIIKVMIRINFSCEQNTQKKLRKIVMHLYSKSKSNGISCKLLLQENFNAKNELRIVKNFIHVMNHLFQGNSFLEEKRFLEHIFTKVEIQTILKKSFNLDISVRTELLIFYRIVYIDTTMKKGNINYYVSLLINDPIITKIEEKVDNQKLYRFFENLVKTGSNEQLSTIAENCDIIKYEIMNFKKVLESNSSIMNNKKRRNYIEFGIILPLSVYLSKFSSLIFDSVGNDYFNLYELLYYFLELKKYIYENKESYCGTKMEKIFKNVFRNKLVSWGKTKKYLVTNELNDDDLRLINEDISKLQKRNFDIFNFSLQLSFFQKHFNGFIKMPKLNGMKDYFEKKSEFYSSEQIDKKKKYLSDMKLLRNEFQQNCFEIIIKYMDDKNALEFSSFIKMLKDDNVKYNCSMRSVVIKNILFYMSNYNYEGYYQDICLWELFRLLQFDTSRTQKSCLELLDKKSKLLNFDSLLQNFTINLMSILIHQINPSAQMIRHDYFLALMIVKILKYFCEEHNQDFQRIFFIKEDNGVILHYNPKQYELTENKVGKFEDDEDNNLISSNNGSGINAKDDDDITKLKYKKPSPDSEIENNHEITRSEEYFREIQKYRASVFEYMLSILGKIILLSNWIVPRENDDLDDYFYDLYFVILEFLIETIQGTRYENLQTVFMQEEGNKHLFGFFLLDIRKLIIEENDTELSYQVRKDMMDFLMAFLEESATPPNGIIEISSVIIPTSILESIVITMQRLFESRKGGEENSSVNGKKKPYKFTPEMKKYFSDLYFSDLELGNDIRFALANRMYQFFKLYSIEDSFKNPSVTEFYDKMSKFSEANIIKNYNNQNRIILNHDKTVAVTDPKFFDNYLCVSFFESITRLVFINKATTNKSVRVLFTLNPIVPLLSLISKDDFINNVDRTDRYAKLLSLVESCDYFFEEVTYKQSSGKKSNILRFITDLNFYWLEFFSFIIVLAINIIMLAWITGVGEALYGNPEIENLLDGLGLANFIYNSLCLIAWMCSKFNLFFLTEKQKKLKSKNRERNKVYDDEIEEEVELTFAEQLYAAFVVIVLKNKTIGFVWNIIFSAAGFFTQLYFIYIVQLFIIVNLCKTLKNLIKSLTVKANQFIPVFYLTVIFNLVFAAVAFFNFSEDFIRSISSKPPKHFPNDFEFLLDVLGSPYVEPSHIENECGTLLYCFITHLDYGMRYDGGIADRMKPASYTYYRGYYVSRFFYEDCYFITLVVLMLNMILGIITEAFSELRNNEQRIEKDKREICFICGIDKESIEKRGEKLNEHLNHVHNIWTYVEYILGLRFVDIQETNAINSYVIENLERKELVWFPCYDGTNGDDGANLKA